MSAHLSDFTLKILDPEIEKAYNQEQKKTILRSSIYYVLARILRLVFSAAFVYSRDNEGNTLWVFNTQYWGILGFQILVLILHWKFPAFR